MAEAETADEAIARPRRARTPTRLQMEATECGAAALAIVLEYHGTYVPLAQLREECGVSRDGSKASNVLKAARPYGFDARGYRKEPNELRRMTMPVIAHWNFNHFLVVEGFGKNKVYLNDPAVGPTTVTGEEFDHSFTGVVLTLAKTAEYRPQGKRPSMWPSLARRLSGSTAAVVFIGLAGLAQAVPGLAAPVFGEVFVDHVLLAEKHSWLPALLAGMALTALLNAVLTSLQRRYLLKLLMRLGVSMSTTFLWHALRLPVGFYFARSAGDLAGRVQTNETVANTLSGRLSGVLLSLLLVVFYGAFMIYLDPLLTLIGVGIVGIHILVLRLASRMRADLGRQVSQHAGKLAGVAAGGLQMIETIKATGSESEFFGQWAGYQAKLVRPQQTLVRREQLIVAITALLSRLGAILVLAFGALRVMNGHLTPGMLVAFQSLMMSFLAPVENLAQVGGTLQQLQGDIERLDDVLLHEEERGLVTASASDEAPRRLTGALELRGVTFGYLPFTPPLVEDLDLKIAPGQRVALVGGTGSGKSTIAKLVCGLYPPSRGEILFDGEARATLPRSALVSSIAMVDQDVALFEGSVRDNLTLWDDTIPETEVVQAAKDACIHEDITKLAGGYEAHVSEGGFNFSGGQRQRLEIARALTRQPSLVVLDEATSALDAETESLVDANLRRRGCACLIIAHRLSTIRDADEIIVLERGRVVQRGSHEALLAEGGTYKELISSG
jgi:NHLM bacteriocin system ABC transporter peptidase/ATP-binding protein